MRDRSEASSRRARGASSGLSGFVGGFGHAFRGIGHVLASQRNAQVQTAVGVAVLGAAAFFRVSPVEWALLLLVMGVVLALEAMNTALEAAVDLVTEEYREQARVAKDSAAGAVLLAALASIGVGVAVFGPRIWAWLG